MASLDELKNLANGEIALAITSSQKYLPTTLEIMNYHLNKKKTGCVYVTINKPYSSLIKLLKENKISTEKLFIIDAITLENEKNKDAENAIFIGSPNRLTDISISTTAAIKNAGNKGNLLFFDSLSTLLIYNESGSITKFMHFIINKIKENNVSGIILSLEKGTDDKVISQISQFVDKVVQTN